MSSGLVYKRESGKPGRKARWLGACLVALLAVVCVRDSAKGEEISLAGTTGIVKLLGSETNGQAGYSTATGDINNDGLADLIIGAPNSSPSGRTDAGKVYVVLGDSSIAPSVDLETGAALIIEGAQGSNPSENRPNGDLTGSAVGSGDVNGDGFDDITIGAYAASPGGRIGAGKVYVIFGAATFPNPSLDLSQEGAADIEIQGGSAGDGLGISLATGDIGGDETDDIIIGAPFAAPLGRAGAGITYVIYGTNDPGSIEPLVDLSVSETADIEVYGQEGGDNSGYSVDYGDFNGDSYCDLLIGANNASGARGEAYVVFSAGPSTLGGSVDLVDEADVTVRGIEFQVGLGDNLGWSVAAGNVNRDEYDDMVIGGPASSPGTSIWVGVSYVVYGGAPPGDGSSVLIDLGNSGSPESPDLTVWGDLAEQVGGMGWAVAAINFNGDGFDDLITTAPLSSVGGTIYGIYGMPAYAEPEIDLTSASIDLKVLGANAGDLAGVSVTGGDFNGDGVDDLIIGAPLALGSLGEVFIVFATPPRLDVSVVKIPNATFEDPLYVSYTEVDDLSLSVNIDYTSGMMVVEADLELAFNGELLDFVGMQAGSMIDLWTIDEQVVEGSGGDPSKVVVSATTEDSPLDANSIGQFMQFNFKIKDVRRALNGMLDFEILSFNGGRTDWNPVQMPQVILTGDDGVLKSTVVSEPGDTVRVRVTDLDQDLDPAVLDSIAVVLVDSLTGDQETVQLKEQVAFGGVFFGEVLTSFDAGFSAHDDRVLYTLSDSKPVKITYTDPLSATGPETDVIGDHWVLLLGDADGNGSRQAYDAATILKHVISLDPLDKLAGVDSLAANVDLGAPIGPITSYDAALVIQHRLGLIDHFPVQEAASDNHPQPESSSKPIPEERLLALISEGDQWVVWTEEREGIIAGDLLFEGLQGTIEMAPELGNFQAAYRNAEDGLRVVFAGDRDVRGSGELLRIIPTGGVSQVRDLRGSFNGGQIAVHFQAEDAASLPLRFALHPNAPNPFNAQTLIRFDLPTDQEVHLEVFNTLGQLVRTLVEGRVEAGVHQIHWDSRDDRGASLASGPYLYRLTAGSRVQTQRMLLLK